MLTTWNAFPMLDRLLDDVMNGGVTGTSLGTTQANRAFSPAIDVRTNEAEMVFTCDVPGVKESDIEVTSENGILTIKGSRRYEGGEHEKVWLGRAYGAFERRYTLPDIVDVEHMSAHLADGVLTVHVPKKAQARPRKITIGVRTNQEKQIDTKNE